ncbi:hypothetical protein [Pseudonocardia sp.]|uniref:hypothetical protein n=1 Tax=Pseudonocardia sp. TaxID=60912 RepID=UPI0031FBAA55
MAEPPLSDDITVGSLDPEVRRDLRGLQKDTADSVARHLVAAGMLVDEDPELALEHARFARTRASRIAVVREAAGIAAYHAGEWSEALGELRAARRMGGGPGHLAVMADIERALGRPERALELSRGPEVRELDRAESIELAIVTAGARRDLGEHDAAVVGLQIPELDPARREPWSARLFYAHADNLLAAGREADSLEWFVHAADADANGETGADLRIAELTGEPLPDDDDVEFGPEELEGLALSHAGIDGDAAAGSGADLDEARDAGERGGHPAEPTDALDSPTAPADSAGTAEAAGVGDALEVGDASEGAIEGEHPEGGDPIVDDRPLMGDGPAEGGDPIVGDGPLAGESPTQGEGRTGAEHSAEDAGPIVADRPIEGDNPIVGEATIEGEGRTGAERSAGSDGPIVAERPIEGDAPILDEDAIEDAGLVAEATGPVVGEGPVECEGSAEGKGPIVGEGPIAGEGPVRDDGVIEGEGDIGNQGLIEDRGRDLTEGEGVVEGQSVIEAEDAVEDGGAIARGDAVVEDGGAGADDAEKAGSEVRDGPEEPDVPDVSHALVTRRDARL